METIRNYLENMFINLPNSAEVIRAKDELLQMMEDKYTELKNEGKTENEAVGIVISEFGNLEEIADDLGIERIVKQESGEVFSNLSLDEIYKCIHSYKVRAFLIAFGVLLCICSPTGCIFAGVISLVNGSETFWANCGLIWLFVSIAIAVGCFIFAGELTKQWNHLETENYNIDLKATKTLQEEMKIGNTGSVAQLVAGIACCILSVLPVILGSELFHSEVMQDSSVIMMFLMIAIGVFLIIFSQAKSTGYKRLLSLNKNHTIGGNYAKEYEKEIKYRNPNVAAVMSVYWPTVTCIYLCWSFLTYQWWVTWLIWPVASLVSVIIKAIFRED